MRPRNLVEFLEVYDFCNRHCKDDPLISSRRRFRQFLQDASVLRSVYFIRDNSRIVAVACGWPCNDLPKDDDEFPEYKSEGSILWCQYCYVMDRYRGNAKNVMGRFLIYSLKQFPQVEALAYRRTKKNGRIFVRRLKKLEAAKNG